MSIDRHLRDDDPTFPKLLEEIKSFDSGYAGEQSLHYYLGTVLEPHFQALQGIRLLLDHKHAFQMDHILIFSKFILIVEVKNLTGIVTIDHELGLMYQEKSDGSTKTYQDPIAQVHKQAYHFRSWLHERGYTGMPVENLVTFVNRNVVLKRESGVELDPRITTGYKIGDLINQLINQYKDCYHLKNTHQLLREIKRSHTPLEVNHMDKLNLTPRNLVPGVNCPDCHKVMLNYRSGKWHCSKCGLVSRDAHISALKDYFLIFGPEITNKKLKYWLRLDSADVAYQIIKKLNLRSSGKNRYRKYRLNYSIDSDFSYLMKHRPYKR
ncbi:nuclease-related domain-containing protein [Alkalibacillus aidingensis]|uniref:nuclease-related domain-containing protein n=1 Tax=Alkalibacillus aidingensis TaxID=2747607 RepID=UPI00166072DF|nr:nuclease-related domain-containing protein [Alkalibacillus aidingensis]